MNKTTAGFTLIIPRAFNAVFSSFSKHSPFLYRKVGFSKQLNVGFALFFINHQQVPLIITNDISIEPEDVIVVSVLIKKLMNDLGN